MCTFSCIGDIYRLKQALYEFIQFIEFGESDLEYSYKQTSKKKVREIQDKHVEMFLHEAQCGSIKQHIITNLADDADVVGQRVRADE